MQQNFSKLRGGQLIRQVSLRTERTDTSSGGMIRVNESERKKTIDSINNSFSIFALEQTIFSLENYFFGK